MPAFTSIPYVPSAPLRAHTVAASIAGCAHACASATFAPDTSRTVPLMRCSCCSSTQRPAGPLARSATRVASCQRCSAGPLMRTKYVPFEPKSVTVPSVPAVAHAGVADDAREAQTRAPATGGPPSVRVTSTRSGVAAPVVGAVPTVGDGVAGDNASQATTSTQSRATTRRERITPDNARSAASCRGRARDEPGHLGQRAGDLFAALPLHEVPHRIADRLALREHEMRLLGDRHRHVLRLCGPVRRLGRRKALGHLAAEPLADLGDAEALREEL